MLREALKISSPLPLVSGEVPRFHGGSLWHSTPGHGGTALGRREEYGRGEGRVPRLPGGHVPQGVFSDRSDGIALKILWIVAVVLGLSITIYQVG